MEERGLDSDTMLISRKQQHLLFVSVYESASITELGAIDVQHSHK